MARYRGRHRAPSTTGRTIARTAIAGAVAGAPLLAAAPAANAAPDSVWDRVAQCESSGNWNINTGNGFFGGLQFTSSTWRAFGGGVFADSANQASREQQIIVAERVLAGQGWGAWPVCSRKAGATGEAVTVRSSTPAPPPSRSPRRPSLPPRHRSPQGASPSAATSSSAATRSPPRRAPARRGRLPGAPDEEPGVEEPQPHLPGPAPEGRAPDAVHPASRNPRTPPTGCEVGSWGAKSGSRPGQRHVAGRGAARRGRSAAALLDLDGRRPARRGWLGCPATTK